VLRIPRPAISVGPTMRTAAKRILFDITTIRSPIIARFRITPRRFELLSQT
jgi:hypothetical protein